MTSNDYLSAIESATRRELAQLCECEAETLPASLSLEQAQKFFGIENPKTLNVWKCTGRHNLVWIKRGRRFEVATESAIAHRMASVQLPQTAA